MLDLNKEDPLRESEKAVKQPATPATPETSEDPVTEPKRGTVRDPNWGNLVHGEDEFKPPRKEK